MGLSRAACVSPFPDTLLLASGHRGLLPRKATAPWMEHSSQEPLKHKTVPRRVMWFTPTPGTDFSHVFLFCVSLCLLA